MSLVTTESKDYLLGNDSCTEFSVEFKTAFNKDNIPHIEVYLADADSSSTAEPILLTYAIDYRVDNANETGFRLIYPISGSPLPTSKRLIVMRSTPVIQNVFSTSVPERKPIENIGDYLAMIIQEGRELLARTPKLPITSDADPNTIINDVIEKADQAIADSAAALSITSGMQASVDNAAQAAQEAAAATEEAIALAEESTHGHTNKDVLDEFGTAGTFDLTFGGKEVAMKSDLPDESRFVGTAGANADAEAFSSLIGGYLSGTSASDGIILNFRSGLLEPRVVAALPATGNYYNEVVRRIAFDEDDGKYWWNGTNWVQEGV